MLSKQYRLKKNKEFGYIFKKGENQFCKNLAVFFVKTKLSTPKVGFSISAKVGNSVVRHLLKRRLSHIVREMFDRIDKGYNYIFMVRKEIDDMSYDNLKKNVVYILTKANKLRSEQ